MKALVLPVVTARSQPAWTLPPQSNYTLLKRSEEAGCSPSFASQKLKGERGKLYLDISLLCLLQGGFHSSVCKGTCPSLPRCMGCSYLSFCTDHTRRGSSSHPLISYLSIHTKVGGILTSGQCSACAGTCPDICI